MDWQKVERVGKSQRQRSSLWKTDDTLSTAGSSTSHFYFSFLFTFYFLKRPIFTFLFCILFIGPKLELGSDLCPLTDVALTLLTLVDEDIKSILNYIYTRMTDGKLNSRSRI